MLKQDFSEKPKQKLHLSPLLLSNLPSVQNLDSSVLIIQENRACSWASESGQWTYSEHVDQDYHLPVWAMILVWLPVLPQGLFYLLVKGKTGADYIALRTPLSDWFTKRIEMQKFEPVRMVVKLSVMCLFSIVSKKLTVCSEDLGSGFWCTKNVYSWRGHHQQENYPTQTV